MQDESHSKSIQPLVLWGLVSWCLYVGFNGLSRDFGFHTPGELRPILETCFLLWILFACYLGALQAAIRVRTHPDLIPVLVIFGIMFRATLLFTEPFQEIDIYRYLWDGQVTASGVSPFRYAPQYVLDSQPHWSNPLELQTLIELRDSNPALKTILQRVHFRELPTVYPPTSQAIFALSAFTTPCDADVSTHLVIMKTWIVLFDLGTFLLLILILRSLGKPVGWSLAYGWCPLVLKEFANSGHLDAIAVFLTTLAVYICLKAFFPANRSSSKKSQEQLTLLASGVLALAVGAKLYPVILVPLFGFQSFRRFGWKTTSGAAIVFLGIVGLLSIPFWWEDESTTSSKPTEFVSPISSLKPLQTEISPPVPSDQRESITGHSPGTSPLPPLPTPKKSRPYLTPPVPNVDAKWKPEYSTSAQTNNPRAGFQAFFSHWKMNDFIFLILVENLTVPNQPHPNVEAWFVVIPQSWRLCWIEATHKTLGISPANVPFFLARTTTALIFFVIALTLAWQTAHENKPSRFLEATFLTIAWFWLLLPTLNPWYWIWALPFLPFARGRAWLAMSGLVLAYYLRFWFVHHRAGISVWPTPYQGALFFDFVITWLEFSPWFIWLFIAWWRGREKSHPCKTAQI